MAGRAAAHQHLWVPTGSDEDQGGGVFRALSGTGLTRRIGQILSGIEGGGQERIHGDMVDPISRFGQARTSP